MDKKGIARINELYHKSREEGLTKAEQEEQQRLRRKFIEDFKANLQNQLEHISVERPDGTIEPLCKKTETSCKQKEQDATEEQKRKE